MLKMNSSDLETIEKQMFNKSRDIDVALFNALFGNMPKEYVIYAITGYQNEDGGFAHALEIDNYNAKSTPYETYEALRIAYQVGYRKMNEDPVLNDTFKQLFNYLYNICKLDKDGTWFPIDESNNEAVCSLKFKYDGYQEMKNKWGVAPTPAIIGYTLVFNDSKSPFYKKALRELPVMIKYLLNCDSLLLCEYISFKEMYLCLTNLNVVDNLDEIKNKLLELANKMVETNEEEFTSSLALPLIMFDGLDDNNPLIEKHLDYIITHYPKHGLWEANHTWGNESKYPENETAMIKWMGPITVRNLIWLRKYKRI